MACRFMIQVDEGRSGQKFLKKEMEAAFFVVHQCLNIVRNVLFVVASVCVAVVCWGECRRCVQEGDGQNRLGRDVFSRIL